MSSPRLLALSSSRVGNGGYLEAAVMPIKQFLQDKPLNIAFIAFAAADNNYEAYADKVRQGLASLGHTINVVNDEHGKQTIEAADVIMVGGGNTFKLLHDIYAHDLLELIKLKVQNGTPYIGWSAGANITGLTIGTTNDMPIIQPKSFTAFGFLPFQVNPHYLNVKPAGHNGETRDDRLTEYLLVNPKATIVGIPEGTALLLQHGKLSFTGEADGVIFTSANNNTVSKTSITPGTDLSYLLSTS
jgi:dipeptidase E